MPSPKQLSSRSSQWFTPPKILDLEREALGGDFDLDPASCETAQQLVRARVWFDGGARGNGLVRNWNAERMHSNFPYSPKDGGPIDPWIERLANEYAMARNTSGSVGLVGGCSVLPATPKKFRPLWSIASIVFLDERIRFVETIDQAWLRWADDHPADVEALGAKKLDALTAAGRKAGLPEGLTVGPAPTGEHAIAYVGDDHGRFERVFGKLGFIIRGKHVT